MMNKIFYVYEHWRPDLNQCFYVGKGSGMRGCYVGSTRPDEYHAIGAYLNKLGLCPEVRIVIGGLTEEDALSVEQAKIKEWLKLGVPIINIYHTPEYVNRLLAGARRGERHPMFGKKHSEATRKKISEAHIGKKRGPRSAETRLKQSAAAIARFKRPGEREKIAGFHRGRKHTPEHRAKVGAASAKRIRTEQSKERCRQSHLRYWDKKRAAEAATKNIEPTTRPAEELLN
jgi:hypothetical protein